MVFKEEDFTSSDVVKELDVDQYLFKFGYYYFASVYSKFQSGQVFFRSGVLGTKKVDSNISRH